MTESRIKTYIKTRLRAPPEGLILRWAKKLKVHRPPAENQHNIIWVYFFLGGGGELGSTSFANFLFVLMFCLVLAFLKSRDLPLFCPPQLVLFFKSVYFYFLLDPA
jgi:hypothetical protein